MPHVMGIDVATTATKAILLGQTGTVVGDSAAEYVVRVPRPGWSEQDPQVWWSAASASIRSVLATSGVPPDDIAAIGLTGQMHGAVLLDTSGEPVRPAILWNDQRTAAECDAIRRSFGRDRLITVTGSDALTGLTAPKLLWVRAHEPEPWNRIAHLLLPKDYVRLRLTGEYAVDKADGAGTLLFDLARRDWSHELIDALELDSRWFPRTFEGPSITGRVTPVGAEATGLIAGTPVVAGAGDQAANGVGVGAVTAGIVALSLGTSGVVFATTDGIRIDHQGRLHTFCHAVPERWHMMGVMLSAGGSLRWLRDALRPGSSYDELLAPVVDIPAGSDGLLFLPYLSGERTPHPDPLAKGAFIGLTVSHGLPHMTRAVLEGVAFGLRDILDLMTDAGMAPPDQVRTAGGGAQSAVWRHILANVLDTEIATVNTAQGAAYGAALLAAVGAGWYRSVDDATTSTVRVTSVIRPGSERAEYALAHRRYRQLYPALAPTFHASTQNPDRDDGASHVKPASRPLAY